MPTNLELAKDLNTSTEDLIRIIGDIRAELRLKDDDEYKAFELAINHENLPSIVLEDMARYGAKGHKLYVASCPRMTRAAFEVLAQDSDMWTNLVINPATPLDFLVKVARTERPITTVGFAPDTPKANIAGSNRTPISILVELEQSSFILVRQRLAQNPNTPEWVRWQLSLDEDFTVRLYVFAYSGTSSQLRIQMVRIEEDPRVIQYMSKSKCTPPLVKMWLMSEYRHTMSLEEFLEVASEND